MNKVLDVIVIIVNRNGGEWLAKCLTALCGQTIVPKKVVLVDNDSTDSSLVDLDTRFPRVQVIKLKENIGFAAANNLAVKMLGKTDWVALLNPDAFPEPSWLQNLLLAAQANPEYAFFGSRMVKASSTAQLDGTGDVYHVSGLVWRRDHGRLSTKILDRAGEIFSPCAAAALYRRDAFLEIGGFDENYFCYLEDVDLGFRLRLLGYRCLYVPEAVVHHVGSAITGKHSEFSLYYGHRNLVWTYVKNMPWPLFWLYLPQHILLNIISVLWFTLRGQGRILCKAKWDALRDLLRVWRQRKVIQSRRKVTAWELRRLMSKGLLRPYLPRRR
jgi:GT2 family glycosyltransferase